MDKISPGFNCAIFRNLPAAHGRCNKAKSRKYQGVFEVKSRVKTWQVRGIWSQQLEHKIFNTKQSCFFKQNNLSLITFCKLITFSKRLNWSNTKTIQILYDKNIRRIILLHQPCVAGKLKKGTVKTFIHSTDISLW